MTNKRLIIRNLKTRFTFLHLSLFVTYKLQTLKTILLIYFSENLTIFHHASQKFCTTRKNFRVRHAEKCAKHILGTFALWKYQHTYARHHYVPVFFEQCLLFFRRYFQLY